MRNKIILLITAVSLLVVSYVFINKKSVKREEAAERKIVLYNWSDYIDLSVLADFEKETGIKVVEEIFDSNETVRAKLLAGADGYDVIVPSGVMISTLIKEGLLAQLDLTKLSNLGNIDPFFKGLYFDPEGKFAVPYLWGATGIGYRKDLIANAPNSWGDLFDVKKIERLKGKLSLLDDPREAIAAALLYLGFSINTTEPLEIDAAVKLMQAQKPFLSRYDSEVYGDFLVSGDIVFAQGWSGSVTKAQAKQKDIEFILPKEGGIMGVDCLVIPKAAKHFDDAHVFINFLLRPDISARIVNKTSYPTANKADEQFIDKSILNNRSIYPARKDVEKMEWLKDVGVHTHLYEKAWERIRYAN